MHHLILDPRTFFFNLNKIQPERKDVYQCPQLRGIWIVSYVELDIKLSLDLTIRMFIIV